MNLVEFDGGKWHKSPDKFSFEEVVVLRNTSKRMCHFAFGNHATFGIECVGLDATSEILLPFRLHEHTVCREVNCIVGPSGKGPITMVSGQTVTIPYDRPPAAFCDAVPRRTRRIANEHT